MQSTSVPVNILCFSLLIVQPNVKNFLEKSTARLLTLDRLFSHFFSICVSSSVQVVSFVSSNSDITKLLALYIV